VTWDASKFERVPKNYWNDRQNRRALFDQLGKQLGVSTLDDWYQVRASHLSAKGAGGFLRRYYQDSLLKALEDIYPEKKWEPWRLKKVPHRFWSKEDNARVFLKSVKDQLGVSLCKIFN
jgi:hypothetical protein